VISSSVIGINHLLEYKVAQSVAVQK